MSDFPDLSKPEVEILRLLRSNINKPEWGGLEIRRALNDKFGYNTYVHLYSLELKGCVSSRFLKWGEMPAEEAKERQMKRSVARVKLYSATEIGKKIILPDTEKEESKGWFGNLVPGGGRGR